VKEKAGAGSEPVDELHERKEDLELPGRFGDYLRFAQGPLLKAFRHADREALRAQKTHRQVTIWAALLGTVAIFASVATRLSHGFNRPLIFVELLGAGLSALLVLWGIIAGWHKRWLLSRYKAEQLRLLKFDFLTEPALWTQPEDVWHLELENRVRQIERMGDGDLEPQANSETVAKIPSPLLASVAARQREEVWRYYIARRLEVQIRYFSGIGTRESGELLRNTRITPAVFFLSVTLLTFHLVLELAMHDAGKEATPAFLVASLLVPALWAGVRTFRSANQFGRNRARSAAKASALTQVAKRLEVSPPPLDSLFQNIAVAESVLATDQGEWLRVMIEAEWFA